MTAYIVWTSVFGTDARVPCTYADRHTFYEARDIAEYCCGIACWIEWRT